MVKGKKDIRIVEVDFIKIKIVDFILRLFIINENLFKGSFKDRIFK